LSKTPKHKPKLRFGGLWPIIRCTQDARWAVKQGMWTAVICAVVTTVFAIWAHLSAPAALTELGVSLLSLIDATMFFGVAVGLYFNSRFAAVAGLGLFLLARIMMWRPEQVGQLVMMAIFFLGFVSGVRGTFAFHQFKKKADDSSTAPITP